MTIATGQNANPDDFIVLSERNATPSNDSGKVAQFESDGRIAPFFTRNGQVLTAGETINGATLPVPVYQNDTDNELYACDANDSTKYKFIGFAISNSTDGNAIAFQGSGVVTGFSGLAEGEKYYVQDTAGTIGTSPGTHAILVGIAISPTDLLIQKGVHRASGTLGSLGTASSSEAITTGFRPSVIRIHALSADGSSDITGILNIIWENGNTRGTAVFVNGGGSSVVSSSTRLYGSSTSNYMTFSISNITDTGFTVQWAESGSYNFSESVIWEAEGEL